MPPANNLMTAALEAKIDAMARRQDETNSAMRELTQADAKLAVIEERQTNDRAAVERAFQKIQSMDTEFSAADKAMAARIEKLELAQPMTGFANGLVLKVVGLALAAIVGANLNGLLSRPAPASTAVTIQSPR